MQLISLINTPQNKVFQYFLTILGQMVHSDLVRQIQFLKVENEIIRSKIDKKVISDAISDAFQKIHGLKCQKI